jgi:hypothetical protein
LQALEHAYSTDLTDDPGTAAARCALRAVLGGSDPEHM